MQICSIFDDPNDVLWSCNVMLNDVVETHAPLKKKYIKKPTHVFINSDIRKAFITRNQCC